MRLDLPPSTRAGTATGWGRDTAQLWRLPPPVSSFYRAALWTALRTHDGWSVRVSLPPAEMANLVRLAGAGSRVVELGTASGWTALALASSGSGVRVLTLDRYVRPQRRRYVGLVPPRVSARVTYLRRGGEEAAEPVDVDLLYIDTFHDLELVLACFARWAPRVVPGGRVVFDDYVNPRFPGPARAVRELGLSGDRVGRMFVWTRPG